MLTDTRSLQRIHRFARVSGLALLLAAAIALPAAGETCLSPYIKGLRQPEKVLYLWSLPLVTGKGRDALLMIDTDLTSSSYGQVLKRVEVGSAGNEAHHMGYTDDRRRIWAASLNSNRFFIFDVSDPMQPKLARTLDDVVKTTGMTGPHTPYAIPGRMLVSMASGKDGTGPGGLAEFTDDGEFVASYPTPDHTYEQVIKPEFNKMLTSSWMSQKMFMTPMAKWDPSDFSDTIQVWDFKARKITQQLKGDKVMLAVRWALKPGANYGFSISNGGNSIWRFQMQPDGQFTLTKAADLPGCAPGDLRQSPDDKFVYVSCIAGAQIQAWDISDPEHIKLHDTIQGVVQPNMMHVTYDGKRLYFTNSTLTSVDFSQRYQLTLVQIGPDGRMKQDPNFVIDFSKLPGGARRPHDMLLN